MAYPFLVCPIRTLSREKAVRDARPCMEGEGGRPPRRKTNLINAGLLAPISRLPLSFFLLKICCVYIFSRGEKKKALLLARVRDLMERGGEKGREGASIFGYLKDPFVGQELRQNGELGAQLRRFVSPQLTNSRTQLNSYVNVTSSPRDVERRL